ncbi:uncharacterized protein TNCV_2832551 [Trichonephila clavipes]|nr:uncharacterized protein TNCV_2832551 [Trichonephila clavipes]
MKKILKVFKKLWEKVFKTAEEAVEYIFSEELESEKIALLPEVDELTDEEGFDDTETLDPSVRDVVGSIEISVPYENHDDHREADLSNKSKKRSCSESGSNTRKKGVKREKKAEKNKIDQPCLVSNYNENMGGVDSHDWLLEKHTIKIRGKNGIDQFLPKL